MFYYAKLCLGWAVHIKTFLLNVANFPRAIPCTAVLWHFHKLCCLEILISSDFHFHFWIINESMQASLPFSIESRPLTILDILPCLLLARMITNHLQNCWKCLRMLCLQYSYRSLFFKSLNTPYLHLTIYPQDATPTAEVLQWPVDAPAVLWTTWATAHSWLCTEVDQEGFEGSVLVTSCWSQLWGADS